jgi:hypothetical protein
MVQNSRIAAGAPAPMSDQGALVLAQISRYDALLCISGTLAHHRTITELLDVVVEG